MGRVEPLKVHLAGALNMGITPDEPLRGDLSVWRLRRMQHGNRPLFIASEVLGKNGS
jgi:hypothetical protein